MPIQVFYSNIAPAEGQTENDIKEKARLMGYELHAFAGWTTGDFFAHKPAIKANRKRLLKIACACVSNGDMKNPACWPNLSSVPTKEQREMINNGESTGCPFGIEIVQKIIIGQRQKEEEAMEVKWEEASKRFWEEATAKHQQ